MFDCEVVRAISIAFIIIVVSVSLWRFRLRVLVSVLVIVVGFQSCNGAMVFNYSSIDDYGRIVIV